MFIFSASRGAAYIAYQVDGVDEIEVGKYQGAFYKYSAVYYFNALADYPTLFNTEWKP